MKFVIGLLTLASLTSAHASYFATHCSNSKGSVKWETGHNSNTLTLENKKIPFYEVQVKFLTEHVVNEERIHECGYAAYTKVFAGKIEITPAENHPDVLDFLGENKKIETEVICTTHVNGRAPCPEIEE